MDAHESGINVRDVLEHVLQLEFQISGDEAVTTCPNPDHPDEKPSHSINLVTGFSHCFSCGFKADLAGVASVVLGVPYKEALNVLLPGTRESLLALLQGKIRRRQEESVKEHRHLPGPYKAGPLDYLKSRGLTTKTCREFGARFTHKEFIEGKSGSGYHLQAAIALPIHDQTEQVGWVYRSTNLSPPSQPRYMYLGGTPIAGTWFGSQLVDWSSTVVIVEGPLDAMWVHQCGYQALACMGSSINPAKARQLLDFHKVVILPDKDKAGILFLKKLGEQLSRKICVDVAHYPTDSGATDPCELSERALRRAVDAALPFHAWQMKQQFARSA